MIDAVIFCPSFSALVEYLNEHAPETLARDEGGNLTMPPNVTAFTRTPAQLNGDRLLAYCRFTDEQADQWRGTPGVDILGEAPFTGKGTADRVYQQIWDNPEALAKYDSVWDRVKSYTDEEGVPHEYEQPMFGIMGGS